MMQRVVLGSFTIGIFLLTVSLASAQTRISSLPYNINNSGQYYLSTSIVSSGGGITVNASASDVTIDLDGNTITGNGAGYGVLVSGAKNVEIKNGSIRNFGNGIYADGSQFVRVIDVRAVNNAGMGIFLDNSVGCVIRNSSSNNNQTGINAWYCLIEGNTANNNAENGIVAGFSQVIGNITKGNGGDGIQIGGTAGVVKNNSSFDNGQYGLAFINGQNVVDGNSAFNNGTNMGTCSNCTLGLNNAP